jgi:hypothetical protein
MQKAPVQLGRRERITQGMMAAFLLIGAIGGTVFAASDDLGFKVPPAVAASGALIAMAVVSVASVIYWRNLDEAAREAHKFAWFWGGSASLVLVIPILPLLNTAQLVAAFGPHPPSDWVIGGVLSLLGLQVVGYSLIWVGWWLVRRH